MPKRYRRKKGQANQTGLLVVLVLALAAVFIYPTFQHQLTSIAIPAIFALSIFASFIIFLLLWQYERRKRARLRAVELADIDAMTGVDFEQYVGQLLKAQGYKIRFTATTGDYGVDLLAEKDHRKYAIQTKRYADTVGSHAIGEVVAGKTHYHCEKALVVTSNYFTPNARTLAASTNCQLIDRDKLGEWIRIFQSQQKNAHFIEAA